MQINRLFEIIYILLDKKVVTARELSEHFEVSARTIYRDIDCLSGAGIPVYMAKGRGGGISLLSEFILNKTVLTELEKSQILSSLKALNSVNLSENDTVIKKLNSFFGNHNTDWIEVDFSVWNHAVEERDKFDTLRQCILSKNNIMFSYFNNKGECSERFVEPLKLFFKSQYWYIYGYCHEREDCRFFKLTRIRDLKVLNETFVRTAPKQICEIVTTPYKKEGITLVLKLSPKMAYRVYDEFEDIKCMKDGSFIVTVPIADINWVYNYILSFGAYCQVIEPTEIREKVKETLQYMIEQYL